MEEENQEDVISLPNSRRYRSPSFNTLEIEALVNLVEKYKQPILNKSTTSSVNQAKDAAWIKIARLFNKKGLGPMRTPDTLKTKWENLKRGTRKYSVNVLDSVSCQPHGIDARVLSLWTEGENLSVDDLQAFDGSEEGTEEQKNSVNEATNFSNEISHLIEDDDIDKNRSHSTFTRQECNLLLKCVKKEKKYLFLKEVSLETDEKDQAWNRITDSFNQLSPQKRTANGLRKKFYDMRKFVKSRNFKNYLKSVGKSHDKLIDDYDSPKVIKNEPNFTDKMEAGSDHCGDDDMDFDHLREDGNYVNVNAGPDPLSSVLNSDLGMGATDTGSWVQNSNNNKDEAKLRIELLNYQMETARLERKRLEDLVREESSARESNAIERAMRLRTARINAVAAEMKLPRSHAALAYTPEEERARKYLTQY